MDKLIDFSDIPGCESPSSRKSSANDSRVSKATKSRISSIFSSTFDSLDNDDIFDLKLRSTSTSHKNSKSKQSSVQTGQLINLDGSPATGSFDWNRLKLEAQVIASEIKDEHLEAEPSPVKIFNIDWDEMEPRKRLFDKENKPSKTQTDPRKEVFLDDQLEQFIHKRKPLASLNKKPLTPLKKLETPLKKSLLTAKPPLSSKKPPTPSKIPMTPSKIAMTPMRRSMMATPSRLPVTPMRPVVAPKTRVPLTPSSLITPLKDQKIPLKTSATLPRRSSMALSKPPTNQTLVKPSLSTRRSIMTPTVASRTRTSVAVANTPMMSSTPLIGKPQLSKAALPPTGARRRSVQPTPPVSTVKKSLRR